MAQKKLQRQKKAPPRATSPRTALPSATVVRAEPQTADGWRQECERLRAELQASRDEIDALRERQQQVLNRIDWVLDSLDSLAQLDNG